MRVLVTGAAGSGSSTLAQALADKVGAAWLEADDFLWLPTPPPYSQLRSPDERKALFVAALGEHPSCVVAGSLMGWGPDVEDAFDTIVFLYAPTAVRLERLTRRETERFGRVDPLFLAWASQYDQGPPEGRSLAKHTAWIAARRCSIVRLDGSLAIADLLALFAAQEPGFRHA
jgi:hypothetical protein